MIVKVRVEVTHSNLMYFLSCEAITISHDHFLASAQNRIQIKTNGWVYDNTDAYQRYPINNVYKLYVETTGKYKETVNDPKLLSIINEALVEMRDKNINSILL